MDVERVRARRGVVLRDDLGAADAARTAQRRLLAPAKPGARVAATTPVTTPEQGGLTLRIGAAEIVEDVEAVADEIAPGLLRSQRRPAI